MIFDLIRGQGFSTDVIIGLFVRVFVIFCVLPIHEYAHAYTSYKLGDETARLSGRLTIAPLAHIDWFGALLMLLTGVGWAKPVPVNMRNFKMKNKKLAMAITSFAGPLSNIVMAFFFMLIMSALAAFAPVTNLTQIIYSFLQVAASINITLAVFNLIPVPPLDGSRLVTLVIPDRYYYKIMQYERYIALGFMVLILFGILDTPLTYLSGGLYGFIYKLASFPFKFF